MFIDSSRMRLEPAPKERQMPFESRRKHFAPLERGALTKQRGYKHAAPPEQMSHDFNLDQNSTVRQARRRK
jgi:hypothetical protein